MDVILCLYAFVCISVHVVYVLLRWIVLRVLCLGVCVFVHCVVRVFVFGVCMLFFVCCLCS